MRYRKTVTLLSVGTLGAVNVQTGPIGDHLVEVVADLPPVTVAEPDAEIVSTTTNDPKLTVGYWTAPTWLAQERAESHSPEQEQPDR